MFENLSERLERSFKILKGEGKITEINVAETLKDVRRALLDADVNYKVAKNFTDTVKQKALGQNVLTAVKPQQLMVKIVHDELASLMGGETTDMQLKGHPAIILMAGLNGAGKTTMSGKLAKMLKEKRHMNPLLAACDTFRPAAMEQLRVLGEQVGVPVYMEEGATDPVSVAKNAIQQAKAKAHDVLIVDTAGRQAIDEELMQQIQDIRDAVQPDEILFVVDAMTGQDAVNTAKEFNERLDYTGVILTKLDGDTRGGAALSIRTVVDKPIKFVGTGEKMEAIDAFHPSRMADRILGMGDIVSLVERAQEQYDEEEARRLQKKIQKNQFDFNDFYSQIQQIKKMGNLKDLAGMIPGVGKALKDVDIDDNAFKNIEAIILSMTPKERTNPECLNTSRRMRLAKGSGTNIQEVNRLIKQFDQTRKMMKLVTNSSKMAQMAKMMKGKMPSLPGGMPGMNS
ncbi:MAG: signal recognition particle protein [Bacteroidaceae bacterium]|nr:signal recognition particle protein [Bacteroidaceae bacterium]MBR1902075.1 signal recognition particle protein [Bacteroidaceae bacterium]